MSDIREGLKANLLQLDGVQVSAYVLNNPTLPTIWIRPSSDIVVTYHETMGWGTSEWNLVVEALVAGVQDIAGQKLLDRWLEGELVQAIESDRTLGGVADDLTCDDVRGYQEYVRPDNTSVFKAEWNVRVITSGP